MPVGVSNSDDPLAEFGPDLTVWGREPIRVHTRIDGQHAAFESYAPTVAEAVSEVCVEMRRSRCAPAGVFVVLEGGRA